MSTTETEQSMDNSGLAHALPRLTTEQFSHVSPYFIRESFGPGQVIIQQGDMPDRFYILISGSAEVWHEDLNGGLHKIGTVEPGEYFGETGLIQNQPRSATIRVAGEGDAEALALDRQHFQAMMAESKATEAQLAREMIQRLINLSRSQD
jgi:CRP-like cAMP-binding protein